MSKHPTKVEVSAGDRYGDWLVIAETERKVCPSGRSHRMVLCRCLLCETTCSEVALGNLRSGHSKCCVNCAMTSGHIRLSAFQTEKRARAFAMERSNEELQRLLKAVTAELGERQL